MEISEKIRICSAFSTFFFFFFNAKLIEMYLRVAGGQTLSQTNGLLGNHGSISINFEKIPTNNVFTTPSQ